MFINNYIIEKIKNINLLRFFNDDSFFIKDCNSCNLLNKSNLYSSIYKFIIFYFSYFNLIKILFIK